MTLIWHNWLYRKDLPSSWKQIYYFQHGGSFNDVVDVQELIWNIQELTVAWSEPVAVIFYWYFRGAMGVFS